MAEEFKNYTAVTTHRGLFCFKVMPFGLVNAPASMNRLMRKLLGGQKDTHSYIDEVLTGTILWKDHMDRCREFFDRVRAANLTLRPSKCQIGFNFIDYLGYVNGEGSVATRGKKLMKYLR